MGSGLVNHAHFQHLFHVSMNLIFHRWRDSLEPLLEGLLINDFDLVFCQIGTAQLPRFQGKMSWYSASCVHTVAWFLVDHPSRPDKYNCWKSASFLCSTDILALQIPCILLSFSTIPGATPTWGMAFTAMTQAILTPLVMVIGAAVRFFTMTTTCLLPVAISV